MGTMFEMVLSSLRSSESENLEVPYDRDKTSKIKSIIVFVLFIRKES